MVTIKIRVKHNEYSAGVHDFVPYVDVEDLVNIQDYEKALIDRILPVVKEFCKELEENY